MPYLNGGSGMNSLFRGCLVYFCHLEKPKVARYVMLVGSIVIFQASDGPYILVDYTSNTTL